MKRMQELIRRPGVSIGTILATGVWLIFQASAQGGGDAEKLLKAMADYVASQKTLSVSYDSDIEVVTSQFAENPVHQLRPGANEPPGQAARHPHRRIPRCRDVFDGKTLTVSNKDSNGYAQIEATGSVEELIDVLREKHGVVAPGADLLLTNVFDVMMADVVEGTRDRQGRHRRRRMRSSGVPQHRDRLADLDRNRRQADPPQICDHQQGRRRGAAIHAAHQGVADRRAGRRLCVQAGPIAKKIALGELGTSRSAAGHHQDRRKEMNRSMLSFDSSFDRCRCRRRGPVVERTTAARIAIVAGFVAEARIGRPLTPMSYAGVARRTTRRAVASGAVATALPLSPPLWWLHPSWQHRWWSDRPARRSWTPTDGLPPSADKESG